MTWTVYARASGQLYAVETYPTRNDARWWLIAWLKANYVPIANETTIERYLPTSSVTEMYMKEDP